MGGSGGPWGPWGPRLPVSGEGSAQRPPSNRAAAGTRLSAASAGGPRRRDAGLRGAFRAEVALRVPRCTPVRSVPERRWKKAGPFQRKVLARCPPNELSEILLRR